MIEPDHYCTLCPRLANFIHAQRAVHQDWFNGPVPTFGVPHPKLLIVGLAPGLKGANRTGRPFTGDYAGDLLYATLQKFGLAQGQYQAHIHDGLMLLDTAITNAVRCVPPQNKPTSAEIKTCNRFLQAALTSNEALKVVLALGRIAHDAVLTALAMRKSAFKFDHGVLHQLDDFVLISSYHCSRYNTNTGRLTEPMFHDVFEKITALLDD